MSKILKRISSITLAAAMAATMAISASAEFTSDTYNGYRVTASVTANTTSKSQTAYTYYASRQARVFVGLAVADAISGETLDEVPRTERTGTSLYVFANTYVNDSPITLFSSHEVVPVSGGDDPWYIYQEEFYVVQ